MRKVWLKTKYDSGMQMEIPHSVNMATAMYGFRELGAEIITYESLDEIYDWVSKEDIVLDYIDQVQHIFAKFDASYEFPNYPDILKDYLGRKIEGEPSYVIKEDSNLSEGELGKIDSSRKFYMYISYYRY